MVEFWGGVTASSWPYATSVTMTLTVMELQSGTLPRSVATTIKYWSPTWSRLRTDNAPLTASISNSEEPFPVRRSMEYVTAPLRPESRSVACRIRTTRPMGISRGTVALYIDWSNVGWYRFVPRTTIVMTWFIDATFVDGVTSFASIVNWYWGVA